MTFRCVLMHDLLQMSEKPAVASVRTSHSFLPTAVLRKIVCRRQQWRMKECQCGIISLPSSCRVCCYSSELSHTETFSRVSDLLQSTVTWKCLALSVEDPGLVHWKDVILFRLLLVVLTWVLCVQSASVYFQR